LNPADHQKLVNEVILVSDDSVMTDVSLNSLFESIQFFMKEARDGNPVTVYGQQMRITQSVRSLAGWSDIEILWDDTARNFSKLLERSDKIYRSLSALEDLDEEATELVDQFGEIISRLTESQNMLNRLILEPDSQTIYWIDIAPVNNRLSVNSAPLEIGTLIEKMLWHTKESIVVTSATLTTDSSFDYIRERLSAHDADDLAVGSPFDYENSVLLYLPTDIPEPNQGSAQKMVETALVRLCKATSGRTLALFTSYAQLKRTSVNIAPVLQEAGITIFEQGEGASASALLQTFRETDQAILLGTRSFWEGVDIQGEKLSVVVIVKLPFDVPSDPVIAARSESFENPFAQYSLPEAILKFRQGFGRLIRSQSDRGIVVILDNRILTKRYGAEFLNSIPKCTERRGSIRQLPRDAQTWLNI
jgi:DNA polymerase-3 subunit epsilon/ATP-dependent DNA helicase DinG